MDIFSENKLVHNMDHYDSFTYTLVGPISMLASLAFILLNIYFKDARKFPGNLLIIISVGELFLATHWFMSGVYSKYVWGVSFIEEDSTFCIVNTYIACIAANVQYVFQLSFLLSIIVMFRNTMKQIKSQKLFIIVPVLLIAASVVLTVTKDKLGKNIYGTCSVKDGGNISIALFLILVYLVFVLTTLYILNRFKRANQKRLIIRNSEEFFKFYLHYAIMMLIYYIIIALNFIFATQLQSYLVSNQNQCYEKCMIIYYLCRLTNNVKVMLPLLSFLLRINDPFIKSMIFKILRSKKKKGNSSTFLEDSTIMGLETSQILKPLQSMASIDQKDFIINQTVTRVKMMCTRTMLMALNKYYKIIMKKVIMLKEDNVLEHFVVSVEDLTELSEAIIGTDDQQGSDPYKIIDLNNRLTNPNYTRNSGSKGYGLKRNSGNSRNTRANSGNKNIMNDQPLHRQSPKETILLKSERSSDARRSQRGSKQSNNTDQIHHELIPEETLSGDVNVFYAKDFTSLIVQRGHHLEEMAQAFDVEKNKRCIKKMGASAAGDGGASGEFFFVTHDGRFFIKTITEDEENVFMDMAPEFMEHLLTNSHSLIGRIVGYFVFKFDILDQRIKVIIIENIFKLPKQVFLRKYDLKGSTYHRYTLKESDHRFNILKGVKETDMEETQDLGDIEIEENENSSKQKNVYEINEIKEESDESQNNSGLVNSQYLLDDDSPKKSHSPTIQNDYRINLPSDNPLQPNKKRRSHRTKRSRSKMETIHKRLKANFKEKNTMKDLDFNKIDGKIILKDEEHSRLVDLIFKDVEFFKRNDIIDYSLIIAVVKISDIKMQFPNEDKRSEVQEQIANLFNRRMLFFDSESEYAYLVGIIDYFQLYTLGKWMEKHFKILANCQLKLDTSSQPADKYAERFFDYMISIFVSKSSHEHRLRQLVAANPKRKLDSGNEGLSISLEVPIENRTKRTLSFQERIDMTQRN